MTTCVLCNGPAAQLAPMFWIERKYHHRWTGHKLNINEIESAADRLVDVEIGALGDSEERLLAIAPPVILKVCQSCASDKFPVSRLETQYKF